MIDKELIAFISQFHVIPEELILQSGISIKKVDLRAGDFFLKPGDCSGKAGFVIDGICRQYYLDKKGREHTKYFQTKGVTAIAFAEAIQKIPSRVFIEAVVDTQIIEMRHPEWIDLFNLNLDTNILARRIAETYFVEKDQREWEFLHLTAKGRYQRFLDKFEAVSHLIPQQHIASYIGITPESLSRILNR